MTEALNRPAWLVRNRNFVLLWAAYGVAAIGDHLSEMALLVERHALDSGRSVRIQALLSFGFFLPFFLLGPVAGWCADRLSRRGVMIAADLIRAAIVLGFAPLIAALTAWLEPRGLGDFAVMLPLMALGVLAAFFSPARQALLPTLIRPDQLVRANALISALGAIGGVLGFTIGGWLVERVGVSANYMVNAVTFGLSALFVLMIRSPGQRAVGQTERRAGRAAARAKARGVSEDSTLAALLAGFRYVRTHRRVFELIALGTLFWASAGVVIACVPAIVSEVFGGGYAQVGQYRGLLVLGMAAGAAVMTILGSAVPLQMAIVVGLVAGGGWLALLVATYVGRLGAWPAALCLFGIGGAGAALLVTIMAALQRFVPNSRRGRVFGVADMANMGAMVAASAALGLPNIPNLDRYVPILLGMPAVGLLVAAALAWRTYRRRTPFPWYYTALRWFTLLYGRFICGVHRIGPCTVPRAGPCILAVNHTAGIDPVAIVATLAHRRPTFLVERKHYRNPLAHIFIRLVGGVPVDRENPGTEFWRGCLSVLHADGCLVIFPQGTYVPPDQPQPPAKPGLAALALKTGVPVIPAHISGSSYAEHPLAAYLKRHRLRIRYGRPVNLSAWAGQRRTNDVVQAAISGVMDEIDALAPAEPATGG